MNGAFFDEFMKYTFATDSFLYPSFYRMSLLSFLHLDTYSLLDRQVESTLSFSFAADIIVFESTTVISN